MTSIPNFDPLKLVTPTPTVTPIAAPATEPSNAATIEPAHKEAPMTPAQLNVLDTMMHGFLADGKLDDTEEVAYVAARAAFTGGWDNVPLPPEAPPSVEPARQAAAAAATVAPQATPTGHTPARAAGAQEYMPNYAFDVAVGDEKNWLPDEAGAMAAYMGVGGDRSKWPEVIAACRANHPGAIRLQEQQRAEQLAAEAAESRITYQGVLPVGFNPSIADLNYMHQMREQYAAAIAAQNNGKSGNADGIYYDILTGSHLQHSQWINSVEGMAVDTQMYEDYVKNNGPLVAVLAKLMHPNSPH